MWCPSAVLSCDEVIPKRRSHRRTRCATPFPASGSTARPRRRPSSTRACCPTAASTRSGAPPPKTPSGPAGMVLTVDFTLDGQRFQGLNGGAGFNFNEAVFFILEIDEQIGGRPHWG